MDEADRGHHVHGDPAGLVDPIQALLREPGAGGDLVDDRETGAQERLDLRDVLGDAIGEPIAVVVGGEPADGLAARPLIGERLIDRLLRLLRSCWGWNRSGEW